MFISLGQLGLGVTFSLWDETFACENIEKIIAV
jgi:hypothetical protein